MSGLALPASLAQLTRCAGEESRYSLAGVQLTDPGGGQYKATVTDGRRLVHVQGYCPETKNEPPGELGCPPDVPVYVPSDAWNTIFRFAPKLLGYQRSQYGEKTAPVRVARLNDGRVLLSSKDRTLTTDQLGGKFPDWRQVLPKGKPVAVVSVQPKLLAETLTALGSMLGDEFQRVTLCFFGPNRPIGLVAKNSVACIDALLMPLTTDEPKPAPAPPPAPRRPLPEKKAPQASIQETVEEYFADLDAHTEGEDHDDAWRNDPDADYDTDNILEIYDIPWDRDVVKAAVEAFYEQHGVTETPETPTTDEEPNA
jgi:hypothetical protein